MKKTLMFSIRLAAVLMAFFSFTSCYENVIDETLQLPTIENNYYSSVENINILKEDAIPFIIEKVESDSLIVFSDQTPEEALPLIGGVLYIPISDNTPYGFLGRVTAIEKGNPIIVRTESVPLESVFEFVSIDTVFCLSNNIEGVYDEFGEPLEYEVVDSTLTDSPDATRAGNYWQGGLIKFPFQIGDAPTGSDNSSHRLMGTFYLELNNYKFDLDISDFNLKYVNVEADPLFKVSLSDESKIRTPKKFEKQKLVGFVNCTPIIIPTPIGIPIILRPRIYLYIIWGGVGEVTASLTLQYQCGFQTEMHYRNGRWNNKFVSNGASNDKSWLVTDFDVNGELYFGSKVGILAGLYSATTGIGINASPKFSIGAEASLSTENLLDINPQVNLAAKCSGDLYFTASLFKRPIAHYSFSTPEYVWWSKKIYLFPQFNDFTVTGGSLSGDVSYQIDNQSFLGMLGVKTGTRIYESDRKTVYDTFYPSVTSVDNEGFEYYNVNVTGLSAGKTYYAAPICSLFNFTWPSSKMHEFSTEASYHAGFRCDSYGHDNIYFDFSISQDSSNTFDMTEEFHDYDGDLERIHFTATYDKDANILSGVIDYHFYEYPDQRRQDAFVVSLDNDDSGYLYCSKVIDNGGCDKMVRIYKNNSTKSYPSTLSKPVIYSSCNIGDCL